MSETVWRVNITFQTLPNSLAVFMIFVLCLLLSCVNCCIFFPSRAQNLEKFILISYPHREMMYAIMIGTNGLTRKVGTVKKMKKALYV